MRVVVAFESAPQGLGEGYRVLARFETGRRESARAVPRASVLQDTDGGHFVFTVEGDRLRKQTVTLGLESDLEWEIREGLAEGDPVIVSLDRAEVREGALAAEADGTDR